MWSFSSYAVFAGLLILTHHFALFLTMNLVSLGGHYEFIYRSSGSRYILDQRIRLHDVVSDQESARIFITHYTCTSAKIGHHTRHVVYSSLSSEPSLTHFFLVHQHHTPKINPPERVGTSHVNTSHAFLDRDEPTGLASTSSLSPVSNNRRRRSRCCLNFSFRISSMHETFTVNQSLRL